MAYADPLAFERARCADIEARARARDLVLRRELIRAEHRANHQREMAEYRAGPVARRIRFGKMRDLVRSVGAAYARGRVRGKDRVMEFSFSGESQSLWQRVRERMRERARERTQAREARGRARTGNWARERTQAQDRSRERVREQVRQREQQRTRQQEKVRVKEKVRTRSRSRSRGQRVR